MGNNLIDFVEVLKYTGRLFLVFLPFLILKIGLDYLEARVRRKRRLERALKTPFHERTRELSAALLKASLELDRVLEEMALVSQHKEAALTSMEQKLDSLTKQEQQLRTQVEALESASPPVADRFATLVERMAAKGERRSAYRDYTLFALGIVAGLVLDRLGL